MLDEANESALKGTVEIQYSQGELIEALALECQIISSYTIA